MKRLLQLIVVVLACLAQIACTSFRVVTDSQLASASAIRGAEPPLVPKDVALITTTDGRKLELRVIAVDAISITGSTDGVRDPVVIPVDQVQRIERREMDASKMLRNTLLFAAVAVVLGYALGRAVAGQFPAAVH